MLTEVIDLHGALLLLTCLTTAGLAFLLNYYQQLSPFIQTRRYRALRLCVPCATRISTTVNNSIVQRLIRLKPEWNYDAADMYGVLDGINCFDCNKKITFWEAIYTTKDSAGIGKLVYCCQKCWKDSYGETTDKIDAKSYIKPSHTPVCFRGAQFLQAFYEFTSETEAFYAKNSDDIDQEEDDDAPIWGFLEVALEFEEAIVKYRRQQIAYEGYGTHRTSQDRLSGFHRPVVTTPVIQHTATVKCKVKDCTAELCYLNVCTRDHTHPLVHYVETGHLDYASI